MTKIYLIRHGEAEGNLYRLWQGHWNGRITPRGYKQIDALAERFKNVKIDALYSSDLRRAMTTAGAISRCHDTQLQTTPRLREINCGPWEGMPFGNVERQWPQEMQYFNNDPDSWHVEGAESFAECRERILSVLEDIAKKHEGQTVAVVSHGMAIRTALAHFLGIASENIRELPHGDNTAVALLNYDGGSFAVEFYNDNSHLPTQISTFARQTWWKSENGVDRFNLRDEPLDPRAEAELYRRCYADSWYAAHGTLEGFTADNYLSCAAAHREQDERAVLKIFSGDELAGLLELDPLRGREQGYGWITLLYLRPEFRGQGLGVQLLGRAICYYEEKGLGRLRLHASADNLRALAFYEANGFRRIGEAEGAVAKLYLMEKDLT